MKELVRREALRVITDWTKRVIWIKGPTGCGKTRMAVEIGGNDYWMNNATAKWFDNYEGQEVAIIDDFRKEQLPAEAGFGFFLRMLDRYRFMVQVKGDWTVWNPKVVIITCPRWPCDEFVRHREDRDGVRTVEPYEDVGQVYRRCTQFVDLVNRTMTDVTDKVRREWPLPAYEAIDK